MIAKVVLCWLQGHVITSMSLARLPCLWEIALPAGACPWRTPAHASSLNPRIDDKLPPAYAC